MADKKIVLIGGGTGSFTLLSNLKEYTRNITALVNMADDGGSTGLLRDELGVLPPGDVRQCLVALGESSKTRDLFSYRFSEGSFKGHSFGNLFISAMEKMTDSFSEAVELASEVLRITGKVLPITTGKSHLFMRDSDGRITKKQFTIGNMDFQGKRRPDLRLEPACIILPEAKQAILESELVVIAPGNLYGSLAPALIVDGVGEALSTTKAKIVYVCNLVNKPNQTDDFMVHDYVDEIERFIGEPVVDLVVYNTLKPRKDILKKYARDNEFIVEVDNKKLEYAHYQSIGVQLISDQPVTFDKNDAIASKRSYIRHDGDAVARLLTSDIT